MDYTDVDTALFTAMAMELFGGGFVSRLGAALMKADMRNRKRIWEAFPDIVESYGPGTDYFERAKKAYYGGHP